MQNHSLFKIFVVGLTPHEQRLLDATVRLSTRRKPELQKLDYNEAYLADVIIIDGQADAETKNKIKAAPWISKKSLILVDELPDTYEAASILKLKRPVQWTSLPQLIKSVYKEAEVQGDFVAPQAAKESITPVPTPSTQAEQQTTSLVTPTQTVEETSPVNTVQPQQVTRTSTTEPVTQSSQLEQSKTEEVETPQFTDLASRTEHLRRVTESQTLPDTGSENFTPTTPAKVPAELAQTQEVAKEQVAVPAQPTVSPEVAELNRNLQLQAAQQQAEKQAKQQTSQQTEKQPQEPPQPKVVPQSAVVKTQIQSSTIPAHILVVDDSDAVRGFLTSKLQEKGIQVTEASSAEDAVLLNSNEEFDCILMDVLMEGMDGYDGCRIIKSTTGKNKVPAVIMLTSRSSPFDKIRGKLAGCDAYLTKPTTATKLFGTINQFIGK